MQKKKTVIVLILAIVLSINVGCGEKVKMSDLDPADFSESDDIEEILGYVIDNEKALNRLVKEAKKYDFTFGFMRGEAGEIIVTTGNALPPLSEKREETIRENEKLMDLAEDVLAKDFVNTIYRVADSQNVTISLAQPPTAPIIAMSRMLEYIESAVDKRNLIVGNWYYQELGLA